MAKITRHKPNERRGEDPVGRTARCVALGFKLVEIVRRSIWPASFFPTVVELALSQGDFLGFGGGDCQFIFVEQDPVVRP